MASNHKLSAHGAHHSKAIMHCSAASSLLSDAEIADAIISAPHSWEHEDSEPTLRFEDHEPMPATEASWDMPVSEAFL